VLLRDSSSGGIDAPPEPRTAAIVDQLSLTVPNLDFVSSARETLEGGGYTVDYFPGRQVTVDFYRELPAHGYDIIILRVHSAPVFDPAQGRLQDEVILFTSEPYSRARHVEEQWASYLGKSSYHQEAPWLFGIRPPFIGHAMEGRFNGTIILAMGCDGLRTTDMGQAFLDKGAGAFVSWNDSVSASHTDASTQRLLEHLLVAGLPVLDALSLTAAELGPDPSSGAELRILTNGG
jgi:hypothetical protein